MVRRAESVFVIQKFTTSRIGWGIGTFCVTIAWLTLIYLEGPEGPSGFKPVFAYFVGYPLMTLFLMYNLIWPPHIIIKPDGFIVKALIFGKSIKWTETSDFRSKKPLIGKGVVQFEFEERSGVKRGSNLSYHFGQHPAELAKILNVYRGQALGQKQGFIK